MYESCESPLGHKGVQSLGNTTPFPAPGDRCQACGARAAISASAQCSPALMVSVSLRRMAHISHAVFF
jgi:hypothetical protein